MIAVGIAEFQSIAWGMHALDEVVKNHHVQLLQSGMVCPGKYLLVFAGRYAEVQTAISRLEQSYGQWLVFQRMIGNLSDGILTKSEETNDAGVVHAIGVIEADSVVMTICAADAAVKTAQVRVETLRLAAGIGGKGVLILSGGIAEIKAALDGAMAYAAQSGEVIICSVISNPCQQSLKELINR